jgi:hypothetical protein
MFKLWSEWDIGEGDLIFATRKAGNRWLKDNLVVADMANENKQSIDDFIKSCKDGGLFCFQEVEIVE